MGHQSQAGFVGYKTQTGKGVYTDPGAVAPNQGVFVRTRSGSLGGNRDLMIPDPEIGGNRDVPDAQLSPVGFSGEYDLYARLDSMAFFLKAALGTAAAPTGTAPTGFTHSITPSDTVLPWVSIEEQIGNQLLNFKYTDAKCNTLHLEAEASGYLTGTVGFIALTQAIQTVPTATVAQRWDTSGLLSGTTVTVTWNGVQLPAKSFSFDVNNNLEDDDFRLGSLFLGDLVEKRREITMGVTIRDQDSALWKTATWGAPAATVPGGTVTRNQVVITITSFEMIPGSAGPPVAYSLVITVPQAVIKPYTIGPSGDDVIQNDLEIQALRPNPATPILTAVAKNSFSTLP